MTVEWGKSFQLHYRETMTGGCRDTMTGCSDYKAHCRKNEWIGKVCQATCGMCGWGASADATLAPTPVPTPVAVPQPSACTDSTSQCESWGDLCESNQWMKINCKVTCG